ncbi:YihY/virulence factor BrkB family protein [Hymenobacter sp. B81]|uniref:YihY/virulence factor BrkB family protein n=1 Tax=Hymenobacter sp. B81 TaxID=3344878 RepID=UPI0037DD8BFE
MTKVSSPAQPPYFWRDFARLLRRAGRELAAHDPLRLGAATAFFTTFALPPILILFTAVLGALYPASIVRTALLGKLSDLIGDSGAGLLEQIVLNVTNLERSRLVTALGTTFLVFVSTTLFVVIQNSLNDLWQVRPRPAQGRLGRVLRERARSGALLLVTGALAVAALVADSLLHLLADYIRDFDLTLLYYLFQGLNFVVSLLILAAWFGATFRNLSHARVPWPALWRGALLTAVLFELGQRLLGLLLQPRNLGPIYGPAASVVLLLLFVFYSAMMFYFGASFTKAYAHYVGQPIRPKASAVGYRLVNLPEPEEA